MTVGLLAQEAVHLQAQWLLALLPAVLCLIWHVRRKASQTTYLLDFHCFVIPERSDLVIKYVSILSIKDPWHSLYLL